MSKKDHYWKKDPYWILKRGHADNGYGDIWYYLLGAGMSYGRPDDEVRVDWWECLHRKLAEVSAV